MRIQLVKDGNALIPVDDDALSALLKIPQGELVTVDLIRDRNPRWHNMYWHLCGLLLANSDNQYGSTKEAVSSFMKIAVGHVDRNGDPLSISFKSMDQTEFESFYSRVSDVVAGLLGTTPDTIRVEIENLTGQVSAPRYRTDP